MYIDTSNTLALLHVSQLNIKREIDASTSRVTRGLAAHPPVDLCAGLLCVL